MPSVKEATGDEGTLSNLTGEALSINEMHNRANVDYLAKSRDDHIFGLVYKRTRVVES